MYANIHEIAKRAGVSIATVSRALNKKGPIKEDTRLRILQIAQEMNYKPNPMARSLSRRKNDTIGVILPELVDEFFTDIIRGIDEEAHRCGKFILVSSSHGKRDVVETALEFMGSGRVDGVILMIPQIHKDVAALIQKSRRPVVLLNSDCQLVDVVRFNINNYLGAKAVTEHLIQHGYRRIGMIQGPEGNCDAEERFRGYRDALAEKEIEVNNEMIVTGDFKIKSGFYGFSRLMSLPEKPQAIFAANDMTAIGVYEAAQQHQLSIPDDVAVVGFDDIYLSRLVKPRLTTVHVPIIELGTKATRYLIKMIDHEQETEAGYNETLSTGLVIGGSCGCRDLNI